MSYRIGLALAIAASLVVATGCENKAKTPPASTVAPAAGTNNATTNAPAAATSTNAAAPTGTNNAAPAAPAPTGPVAKVNGVEIPRDKLNGEIDDLKNRFKTFGGSMPEAQIQKFQTKIVNRLVEEELIKQKLDKEKVEVTPEELEKEFAAHKAKMPGGDAQFAAFLKRSGMTEDDIKKTIKEKLVLKAYLNKNKELDVTDEEAAKYFEENKKRYEVKERVRASHILIKVADDKAAAPPAAPGAQPNAAGHPDAEAKKLIDEIYKEAAKKGADFAAIAKAKSEGPSAPRGGDLNWFSRGRMVKEFEDAAFKMKPGEVSKPVKTKFGYHVIKVVEREEAGQKKLEEVKEEIVQRLSDRKFRTARQKFVEDLKREGKIEILDK